MVPDGWMLKSFGEITNIANGQVDPRVEPYCNLPHVGPENVVSGSARVVGVKSCIELDLISGKYQFDQHAIVYSKIRPNLNKVCIPGFSGLCSADMYPIWPKDGVDARFLLQLMLGPEFVGRTTAVSMRTGMPKINRSDLTAIPVRLPPLAEQQKIAEILSTWDDAITSTENLLDNSLLQKKALMQKLLNGQLRLQGFHKDWQVLAFGRLFKERVETGKDNLPLLSITTEDGVINRNDVGRKDTSNADKSKYLRICPNDIGYNTMRMWQGVSGLSSQEGIVSPAYTILTPQAGVDPLFSSYLFKLPALVHVFYRHSQGMVSDTWNLKYSNFAKIKWLFPALEEQKAIASVLLAADKKIQALRAELACLTQEKKALMQQLLTGKRRVKVDALEIA